jgi:hypothetical protein
MVSQSGLEGVLRETTPVKDANHLNNRLNLLGDAFFDADSPVMMFEDLNPPCTRQKDGTDCPLLEAV